MDSTRESNVPASKPPKLESPVHKHCASSRNYILIDYENVQPTDFNLVPDIGWQVKIFLRPKQDARHASLNAAQRLGTNCKYITVLKPGRNALDFHIAYYPGVLSRTHGDFYIIAEDSGYDPLLEQLRIGNIVAQRYLTIADIPSFASKAKAESKPPIVVSLNWVELLFRVFVGKTANSREFAAQNNSSRLRDTTLVTWFPAVRWNRWRRGAARPQLLRSWDAFAPLSPG